MSSPSAICSRVSRVGDFSPFKTWQTVVLATPQDSAKAVLRSRAQWGPRLEFPAQILSDYSAHLSRELWLSWASRAYGAFQTGGCASVSNAAGRSRLALELARSRLSFMAPRKTPAKPPPPPVKDRLSSVASHPAARAVKLTDFGSQWRHWAMIQGKLFAPDGQVFTPEDLLEVRQLREELKACKREVASLLREQEEASRSLEDQPLPKD